MFLTSAETHLDNKLSALRQLQARGMPSDKGVCVEVLEADSREWGILHSRRESWRQQRLPQGDKPNGGIQDPLASSR